MNQSFFRIQLLLASVVAGCVAPGKLAPTAAPLPLSGGGSVNEIATGAFPLAPVVVAGYQEERVPPRNVLQTDADDLQPEAARQYYDDPAVRPERQYSGDSVMRGDAPVQAGDAFVPPPPLPPTPGVNWHVQESYAAMPLRLSEAESLACKSNPTLLQARAEVQGELGKAIQAGLWPNPTLIYQAEQIGVEGTAGEFHGALVRQRIVTAHKLDLSREKFHARTQVAEWHALAQQYRVLNDVRIHYFRARGRQEIVEVQRELLKNAEDAIVTAREMYNVGQATLADVHEANVALQRQRLDLMMAENDFLQAFEELTALVGVDLPPSLLETPLEGDLAIIAWDDALGRLQQDSPQINAARAKLVADRLTIRREVAEPVPDIIVEAGSGYNFEAGQNVGAAGLMMEIPLYDWNQGTIRQAEADYARQQGEVRRTELLLRRELATVYRNYLVAIRNVRNYDEVLLPESRAAYDLRLQSYEVDRIRWTDVLATEQAYFLLRQQYIVNLIAWREHETSIMGFLLHGGLQPPPEPIPPGHIDAQPKPR